MLETDTRYATLCEEFMRHLASLIYSSFSSLYSFHASSIGGGWVAGSSHGALLRAPLRMSTSCLKAASLYITVQLAILHVKRRQRMRSSHHRGRGRGGGKCKGQRQRQRQPWLSKHVLESHDGTYWTRRRYSACRTGDRKQTKFYTIRIRWLFQRVQQVTTLICRFEFQTPLC